MGKLDYARLESIELSLGFGSSSIVCKNWGEDRTAQKGNVRDPTNELVATGKLKRKSGQVQGSSKAQKVSEAGETDEKHIKACKRYV